MENGNATPACECQYTVTLIDQPIQGEFSELKDNFNYVPNIHEVDEEETDDEESGNTREQLNNENSDKQDTRTSNVSDEEFTYTGEFFYSDNSSDESEIVNNTVKSEESLSDIGKTEDSKFTLATTLELSDIRNDKEDNDEITEKTISEPPSYNSKDELLPNKFLLARETKSRKKNMTFTDEEVRKIERENELLLRKIMAQQKPREKLLSNAEMQQKTCSSAINRKKLQKRIDYDNMLLLRKIQQAKSCVMNTAKKSGCRLTFL